MEISPPAKPANFQFLRWLIFPITGAVLVGWLLLTPPGFLAKADAIAYAICHRISSHSFQVDGTQFPLCARCTGMYLGALLGLAYQFTQPGLDGRLGGRRGKMPSKVLYSIMGLLVVAFGIDGVNSYLHFFPSLPSLYQPENWLRLVTGTGMGLTIAAGLFPAFHQTMWKNWEHRSALGSGKQLLVILGLAILMIIGVLSGVAAILYPLMILSVGGVMVLLTIVYSMVLVLVFRKDNQFESYSQLWLPLLGGFSLALLQIAILDLVRFSLTGTWSGFSL